MAAQDFRVSVSGGVVSLDAWRRAMEAEESELPPLSSAQKEAARIVSMAEPEYARGVLADEIGWRRQQEIGKRLGEITGDILDAIGGGWELESLVRKGVDRIWVAYFVSADRMDELQVPVDLANDVVESGDPVSRKRLEWLLRGKFDSPARRAAS